MIGVIVEIYNFNILDMKVGWWGIWSYYKFNVSLCVVSGVCLKNLKDLDFYIYLR